VDSARGSRTCIAAPLILALLAGCGGQSSVKDGYATTRILYFDVKCLSPGPNCQDAKRLLDAEIPKFKYTFTHGSSYSWPYYKTFPLDAEVPLDSLLPPHSQLHQLVPDSERSPLDRSAYLVVVELYAKSDSIPDYIVNVYQFESGQPVLSGTSGPQVAQQRQGMSLSTPEILLMSVIRFSFK
jgi:hypothetical protein